MKTEQTVIIFAVFSAFSFLLMIDSGNRFGSGDYLALVFGTIGTVLALCAAIGIVHFLYKRWIPGRKMEDDLND